MIPVTAIISSANRAQDIFWRISAVSLPIRFWYVCLCVPGGCFVSSGFIDTGRDSNNAGYTAALAADLVLIPCRPGGFDFRALGRTIDLCRLAGKRPHIVLNSMRPGANRAESEAREALAAYECDIAPVTLHDRAAYRHASIADKTAQETEPKSATALEIGQLHQWLLRQLTLSPKQQHDKKAI